MVKLTMVGRVSDGLPLAQASRHSNEENPNYLFYKQQAELILGEISRGALAHSKMSIRIDHHCFHYMIEKGICYIALCDSSYPRKLAFCYLQDLQNEFEKEDQTLIQTIATQYALTKFDFVIERIRKGYLDTRTQANLSKLNADRQKNLDIITEDISKIIVERKPEITNPNQRMLQSSITESSLWSSEFLEGIALRWTPITILVVVAVILLWASLILTDYYIVAAL